MNDQELLNQRPLPYKVYPGKRIIVTLGGKKVVMRWTPSQRKRYFELMDSKNTRIQETKTLVETLTVQADFRLDILEIALNPRPDAVEFTKEDLENNLDLNEQGHLANLWANELLLPELNPQDPALTPGRM